VCLALSALYARAQGVVDAPGSRQSPYYLVLLVQATGLDYQNHERLLRSLYKSQMKGGFVGHAWVLLSGVENGQRVVVEAGLSPKDADTVQFFRGVLELAEYGYVNPTEAQKSNPRYEPNPISYLWRDHDNGHLQLAREAWLRPTFAARFVVDAEQYRHIKARLDPKLPSHRRFQLTGQQCSSFVAEIAALAGIDLQHRVTISIPNKVKFDGREVRLWSDPKYSSLTISSPDIIQADLKRLVARGQAEDVLAWYFAGIREAGSQRYANAAQHLSGRHSLARVILPRAELTALDRGHTER